MLGENGNGRQPFRDRIFQAHKSETGFRTMMLVAEAAAALFKTVCAEHPMVSG